MEKLDDHDFHSFNSLNKKTNLILNYRTIIENIKTEQCNLKSLCLDKKECFKYHNILERRRDPKSFLIKNNSVCKFAFLEGKWIDPIKCPKGDYCDYYHSRNELFYDKRNFRKLYDCYIEQEKGKCPYFSLCSYKHNIDVNINEIFLPAEQLKILERSFIQNLNLIDKLNKIKKELKEQNNSKIAKCAKCAKYLIDSLIVLKCMHCYCSDCLQDLKQTNKNCIFNCLKNNRNINNNNNNKFDLNSEYFIKSLKDNLDLNADKLSKKVEVVVCYKKNRKEIKDLVSDKQYEKNNEETIDDKIDQLFDSNNNDKLNYSFVSENAMEKQEDIEDSYEFIDKAK